MNGMLSLATAIAVSLTVSTAVLLMLVSPLKRVLAALCNSGESTPFWVSFTIVMLYAVPLFCTVLWSPTFEAGHHIVRLALAMSLLGIIGGLSVMGYKIAKARRI